MMHIRRLALTLLACTSVTAHAAGQVDAAPSTGETAGGPLDSGEIVVTARRTRSLLRETPLAVSALSGDDLDRLGVRDFQDLVNFVPGVSFETAGAGQTQVNIRGVTTGPATAPTVGVYVDEVPYGGSASFSRSSGLALDIGLVDLERVEVLRGPQGTNYGASAMGGLVKYVTRAPSFDAVGATGEAELSSTRHGGENYLARASVNLPIARERVALRAGGYYARDAGFIDDVARSNVNRSEVYGGRLDLLVKPLEDLSVRLTGFAQDTVRGGRSEVDKALATRRPIAGPLEQRRQAAEPFDQDYRLAAATIEYALGEITLTSVTSYQTIASDAVQDTSALYDPLLTQFFGIDFDRYPFLISTYTKRFSQEARVKAPLVAGVDVTLGGFFARETSTNDQFLRPIDAAGAATGPVVLQVALPSRLRETAGFVNVDYALSPRFDVALGARLSRNDQTVRQIGGGLLVSPMPLRSESEETVATYLINPRYKLSDNVMVYGRAASGYRPGGPNALPNDPATGQPIGSLSYDSDSLWSYEAGLKATTPDRSLSADLAVYHIDWDDLQIFAVRNGFGTIVNSGAARITGVEMTLGARPSTRWSFSGIFAYTDAKLQSDSADLGGLKGDRLPAVPKLKITTDAEYRFPVGSAASAAIGATLAYTGDRPSSFRNSGIPLYPLDDYVTADLRASFEAGRWRAKAFVRNLFDVRGEVAAFTGYSVFGGPAGVTVLQPRTIGVALSVSY